MIMMYNISVETKRSIGDGLPILMMTGFVLCLANIFCMDCNKGGMSMKHFKTLELGIEILKDVLAISVYRDTLLMSL